jgi:hypothetical protein
MHAHEEAYLASRGVSEHRSCGLMMEDRLLGSRVYQSVHSIYEKRNRRKGMDKLKETELEGVGGTTEPVKHESRQIEANSESWPLNRLLDLYDHGNKGISSSSCDQCKGVSYFLIFTLMFEPRLPGSSSDLASGAWNTQNLSRREAIKTETYHEWFSFLCALKREFHQIGIKAAGDHKLLGVVQLHADLRCLVFS